jgi:hypothetical protein
MVDFSWILILNNSKTGLICPDSKWSTRLDRFIYIKGLKILFYIKPSSLGVHYQINQIVQSWNTVTIWKPDIRILEPINFQTYLCPVFEWSLTILFPGQFSNGLLWRETLKWLSFLSLALWIIRKQDIYVHFWMVWQPIFWKFKNRTGHLQSYTVYTKE